MKTFEQYIREAVDFRLGGKSKRGFEDNYRPMRTVKKGDTFYYWYINIGVDVDNPDDPSQYKKFKRTEEVTKAILSKEPNGWEGLHVETKEKSEDDTYVLKNGFELNFNPNNEDYNSPTVVWAIDDVEVF